MMVSIIEIVLYTKPTDEQQYLLRSSCHPLHMHTKRAFPFSLDLRIQRICSSIEMFKLRCNEHKHNTVTDVDTIWPLPPVPI